MNFKFTEPRKQRILDALRRGETRKTAALLARVTPQTFYNWLNRAELEEIPEGLQQLTAKELRKMAKEKGVTGYSKMNREQLIDAIEEASLVYTRFAQEVEFAEAEGFNYHLENVRRAGEEDWRASAWYLERRDPDNYAKRDRLSVDNQHSGSIKTQHEEHYKIEFEQRLEADPKLQELYLQIWEREQLASSE